ncbi:MAG: hypothetical protein IT381_00690 [Deltaproteobacteria bacterium]|nr:hypothetical protein [Deltaproteobacteria bacterium]
MKRLDDALTDRDGSLYIEERQATQLLEEFGSPLFVVSEDQIRRNVRRFQTAFSTGWTQGPVKILPAAKASWSAAVQSVLASEGCGCDTYSPGELAIALNAGFDPALISVNGFPKDPAHVRHSVEVGARLTIDSLEEIDAIEAAAKATGTKAKVRVRLKPVLSGFIDNTEFASEGLIPTDLATLAYKGGLGFEEAVAAGKRVLASPHLQLVGFHQHHGRHDASLRYWEEQMRAYAFEIARVCEALGGYRPKELDIGGGYAIPRDPHNAATDYTEPLKLSLFYMLSKTLKLAGDKARYKVMTEMVDRFIEMAPKQKPAPSIEEYAATATSTLTRELSARGIDTKGVMLQLEPGRSIHGNSGVHLTTVRGVKRVVTPVVWNIVAVDTTEFWLTGGRYEHHLHDFRVANRMGAACDQKADIVGASCFADRLLPAVRVPELAPGDVIAFLDAGAYQEVSASNFNALPRPATVLVSGKNADVIRRRETLDDVFQRDLVPKRLGREKAA